MVNVVDWVPPNVPLIVTVVVVVTGVVWIVNVAVVDPAGTTTNGGTLAAKLLDNRFTVAPAAGAGPVRVTVPVTEPPPGIVVGDTEMD